MKNGLTYKGFIVHTEDNDYYLITKVNDIYFRIPVNESKNRLLEGYSCCVVYFRLFDGTQEIHINTGIDMDFDDVFLFIENQAMINLKGDITIEGIILNHDETTTMWGLVEEYYNLEIGRRKFEEFSEKKPFNN